MSRIRANNFTDKAGTGAPTFPNGVNVTGVSTFGNVVVGGATTDVVINGDLRVTGIITTGTSSITIDAENDQITVGSATTIHSTGYQIGSSNLHSTGLEVQNINVSGVVTTTTLKVGTGVTISGGIVTATTYYGSGANLTGIDATQIQTGNTSVQTVDTGSDGHVKITTEGTERARIDSSGRLLVGPPLTAVDSALFQFAGAKTFTGGIPQNQLNINDTTSLATGVGGAIGFSGKYHSAGYNTTFGSIEGIKENSTDGNYGGALVFKSRQNGGNNNERMRITSTGQLLSNTTTDNAAIRANFAGDSWGGGTGSNTNTGLSLPQFLFTGCGLDNSGTVTPIGFNIRGGGGGVPRGLCFAAHGSYQGNSASNHNVFFVRNVGNTGQTWNTVYGTPGVGIQAGPADAYAGPHASQWWTPSFAAQFGIKDETTGTYDGGSKVGQTIELGGTYGGGTPGNWGGTCLAVRIATNFGSGSTGTNFGYRANISGAGSGNNWGIYIDAGNAAKPGGGSWSSTSDERVKTVNATYAKGLSEVVQLNPVRFTYNGKAETPDDGQEYVGLLAQEVQQVLPDMVTSRRAKLEETDEEETDILMVDPSELVYTLINACKELKTHIETLETQNAELKARLDAAGL